MKPRRAEEAGTAALALTALVDQQGPQTRTPRLPNRSRGVAFAHKELPSEFPRLLPSELPRLLPKLFPSELPKLLPSELPRLLPSEFPRLLPCWVEVPVEFRLLRSMVGVA